MKVLLIGSTGLLGSYIRREFEEYCFDLLTPTVDELNITSNESINLYFDDKDIDIVINCAAYTNVERAEQEPKEVLKLNTYGPTELATICNEKNILFIHISTDYIFDGKKPLNENNTEEDIQYMNPLNIYGLTKLSADKAIQSICNKYYIFRTAWLYGNNEGFPYKVIEFIKANKEMKIVNDQFGCPTFAGDLAKMIKDAIVKEIPYGIYNAANEGYMSWYDLAIQTADLLGLNKNKIKSISSEESDYRAKRPHNSRLSMNKLRSQGIYTPLTIEALSRCLRW